MKNFILSLVSIVLFCIISTCDPWDLSKRSDHLGSIPDTCCNGDCDVDTCQEPQYITFKKFYGTSQNEAAQAVIMTNDGGYVIIGETVNSMSHDFEIYLIKIDSLGNKVWDLPYGDDNDEYGVSGMQLEDGSFIILGNKYTDTKDWQNYLIETDLYGNVEGQELYGIGKIDKAYSIIRRVNNTGYFLFGYTGTFQEINFGLEPMLFVIKENLEEETRKNYGGQYDDFGYSIDKTEDSLCVLLVSMGKQDKTQDLHLIKLDQNYNELWNEVVLVNCQQIVSCVKSIPGGGFIIAGAVSNNRLRLIKTDNNGQNPVEVTYLDSHADSAVSVIPTQDGGFIALTSGMVMIKTNAMLIEQWREELEGDVYGNQAILQTTDKGYILVGSQDNPSNSSIDVYVVKTDSLGKV